MFLIAEEMLLALKIFSPITNYLLHIINNDTGEDLDILFNKAVPHIYQPNKVDIKVIPSALVLKVHIAVVLFHSSLSVSQQLR